MAPEKHNSPTRLDACRFDLPVHELRMGFRTAVYFWRTKRILEQEDNRARITHQIFQRNGKARLCGTDEVIQILRCATGYYRDYEEASKLFQQFKQIKKAMNREARHPSEATLRQLVERRLDLSLQLESLWVDRFDEITVHSLFDGDEITAWETVMFIEGAYSHFAHLESVYLGILARRTKICTNCSAVVEATQGKPLLFFTDRFDHFRLQDGDGYAAHLAGVSGVACDAMASWYDGQGLGTIPHAMIVAYKGDTAQAAEKFNQYYPEVNTIALVDFDNDCVATSLKVARKLGDRLWGVRLDTAGNLVDKSLAAEKSPQAEIAGVSVPLVEKVRAALDAEGFAHVKIIVSGGFNPEKIARFEQQQAPVDSYAVGSWILSGQYDFTADAVCLEGRNLAKVGRTFRPNPRLQRVT